MTTSVVHMLMANHQKSGDPRSSGAEARGVRADPGQADGRLAECAQARREAVFKGAVTKAPEDTMEKGVLTLLEQMHAEMRAVGEQDQAPVDILQDYAGRELHEVLPQGPRRPQG